MQEPSVRHYIESMVPFVVLLLLWVGGAVLFVWAVILLRRMSRSLEQIVDILTRRGPTSRE